MNKLTPFSRVMIALLIVGGVYFGIKKFFPNLGKNTETAQTEQGLNATSPEPGTQPNGNADNSATDDKSTNGAGASMAGGVSTFTYSPTEPVDGKLKGVVEMGAAGFNSFIIRIDKDKNWKLEKADYGASLVYESMASEDDIRQGLKKYISDMLAFGVSPREIHFVISSGAKKVDITSKITAALKGMKYVVNEVTPEQEGKLALRAVMPQSYESKAFVVDIGSGNTKISWVEGNGLSAIEAPGAKYFQKGVTDQQVATEVAAKAKQIPEDLRKTAFIIGGVPFELAKQTRNGKERYTTLKAPADYKAEGEKQKAGLNIYKSLADATGCDQFVFDWNANFTIGFLLNL